MNKDKILDYVMHTPGNTNPNVLGSMLEGMGGGGDNLLIVNATTTDFHTVTGIDKTFDEIVDFALQGGIVVMRLVSNSSGAPYAEIYYLTLENVQSDYSTGGSLFFRSAGADNTTGPTIYLGLKTVVMQTNGDATFTSVSKALP